MSRVPKSALRNQWISEEKGLFPPFSGFPRCCLAPPTKGEKGRKRALLADTPRIGGSPILGQMKSGMVCSELIGSGTILKKQI